MVSRSTSTLIHSRCILHLSMPCTAVLALYSVEGMVINFVFLCYHDGLNCIMESFFCVA